MRNNTISGEILPSWQGNGREDSPPITPPRRIGVVPYSYWQDKISCMKWSIP